MSSSKRSKYQGPRLFRGQSFAGGFSAAAKEMFHSMLSAVAENATFREKRDRDETDEDEPPRDLTQYGTTKYTTFDVVFAGGGPSAEYRLTFDEDGALDEAYLIYRTWGGTERIRITDRETLNMLEAEFEHLPEMESFQ
jgi:hypothetical protein